MLPLPSSPSLSISGTFVRNVRPQRSSAPRAAVFVVLCNAMNGPISQNLSLMRGLLSAWKSTHMKVEEQRCLYETVNETPKDNPEYSSCC